MPGIHGLAGAGDGRNGIPMLHFNCRGVAFQASSHIEKVFVEFLARVSRRSYHKPIFQVVDTCLHSVSW